MVIEAERRVERKARRDDAGSEHGSDRQVLVIIKNCQPAPDHKEGVQQREECQPLPGWEIQGLARALPGFQRERQRQADRENKTRAEPEGRDRREQPAGEVGQPDLQDKPQTQTEQR